MMKFAILCGVALGAASLPVGGVAQDSLSFLSDTASVTYGPYVRLEYSVADMTPKGGYWHPPNYPVDPVVTFDLSGGPATAGGAAIGFDWQNGFRADLGFLGFGETSVDGPCSGASDGTPCAGHADITDASVSSNAVMANVFFSPLERGGSNSRLQPFIVAGLGVARNEVSDWTRENPASLRPVRVFEGDTTQSLAWSIGAGVAWQVTSAGSWPVLLEFSWRYYDLGEARGGDMPLPGNGASRPARPLTFDNTQQTVSLGLRIPLKRY